MVNKREKMKERWKRKKSDGRRGESESTKERAMAQWRGHNHQRENERDGKKETTTMRKFNLKRKELEGAPTTNRNMQPQKLKYNVQRKNHKKNFKAFEHPLFHTSHTHEQ